MNVTQHLLQGWGSAVNGRNIQIAKNNREVNDLQFKQQVINIVASIINLYWDLVSFNQDVRRSNSRPSTSIRSSSATTASRSRSNSCPITIVQAEAELASAEQDLTISQTRVSSRKPKNALSRKVASASVGCPHHPRLHPVPQTEASTDSGHDGSFTLPPKSDSGVQLVNDNIALSGSAASSAHSGCGNDLNNNGLASAQHLTGLWRAARNPLLRGWLWNGPRSTFRRNFPDYNFGVQLNIPLRNRSAQADMILDQLTVRQREIASNSSNQIRVDVRMP